MTRAPGQIVDRIILGGLVGLLLVPSPAFAHEGLHAQIARATKRIEQEPGNAELYLKRGELHRLHKDWDRALADFETVARLDPEHGTLDYSRGRLFREAGWPRAALVVIDRFLVAHADHGTGHLERGRILVDLERPLDAADAYDRAVATLPKRDPDLYLARSRVLAGAGPEHLERALAGLEQGTADLGEIVALELEAVEIETRLERFDAALARLDRLQSKRRRAETWLVRKAEVLEAAGRTDEAIERYREARAAIAALPPRHRNVAAVRELSREIDDGLARIAPAAATPD